MANADKKERPLILELEDMKRALLATINTAAGVNGIPCYFIEPILADLLAQVKDNAKKELDNVRAQYDAKNEEEEE